MKILGRRIIKGVGFLRLVPTDEDDFWYLYNLLAVGDIIRTTTHRKIVRESQTGSKTSEKRRINVLLKVCEINYWAEQHLLLSIKGRNCRESHWLSLGQFHTYEVEVNQQIVIFKENWDYFHFNILNEIKANQIVTEVAALVMEEGVAHLCLINTSTTRLKQKIEKHIVKKRDRNEQRDKSMNEFFMMCFQALEVDQLIESVKCLIIASPGFVKDDFMQFLKQITQKEQYKHYAKCLDKIFLTRSSNGYLNSLMEILQDPQVQNRLEDTKAIQDVKILDKFFNTLRVDFEKVAYGKKDVQYAHSLGAIQTLMLTDTVARAKDPKIRKDWIKIMEQVKSKGGEVYVFSSLHPSGKQLNNYTGIAAILYVAVQYDYEDDDEEVVNINNKEMIQQNESLEEIKIDANILQELDQFEDQDYI